MMPMGFQTDAWDWKMNLKKGDFIDACDEYKSWYRGTVLDVRERKDKEKQYDCLGNPVKEI
jgi:hypothetical protein